MTGRILCTLAIAFYVQARARVASADPPSKLRDEITSAGRTARGLYFSNYFVRGHGARGIQRAVRGARMNAAVIDVKDTTGHVFYDTAIPELARARLPYPGGTHRIVAALKDSGIYTIARIVCFNDPLLAASEPSRAIQDVRPGRQRGPWRSWGTGTNWLDPYHAANQELMIRIAEDAERLGFDEIQLDYVRWPVDDGVQFARYPSERPNMRRRDILRDMLRRMDERVGIPLGVDVFGMSALHEGDPSGLGQDILGWADYVEVFTPMLYINGHSRWRRRLERGRAETLVRSGSYHTRRRLGSEPVVRPFMQAFAVGADYFGNEFIREQIRGARSGRADGYLFWHPGSSYRAVGNAMRGAAE